MNTNVIQQHPAVAILREVEAERYKQDAKWGEQNHTPAEWLAVLTEEVGEVAQEVLRHRFGGRSLRSYREELIQVAAVAVAMAECLDRDKWGYMGAAKPTEQEGQMAA